MHSHNAIECIWSDPRCPTLKEEGEAAAAYFDEALETEDYIQRHPSRPAWAYQIPKVDINEIPKGLTAFELIRQSDESGVSGTGLVLQGIVFNDGTVAVRWCTENAGHSSTVYGPEDGTSGWQKFLSIHVLSPPTNGTRITFYPSNGCITQYKWEQPAVPEKKSTVEEVYAELGKLIDRMRAPLGNKIVWPRLDFRSLCHFPFEQDETCNLQANHVGNHEHRGRY